MAPLNPDDTSGPSIRSKTPPSVSNKESPELQAHDDSNLDSSQHHVDSTFTRNAVSQAAPPSDQEPYLDPSTAISSIDPTPPHILPIKGQLLVSMDHVSLQNHPRTNGEDPSHGSLQYVTAIGPDPTVFNTTQEDAGGLVNDSVTMLDSPSNHHNSQGSHGYAVLMSFSTQFVSLLANSPALHGKMLVKLWNRYEGSRDRELQPIISSTEGQYTITCPFATKFGCTSCEVDCWLRIRTPQELKEHLLARHYSILPCPRCGKKCDEEKTSVQTLPRYSRCSSYLSKSQMSVVMRMPGSSSMPLQHTLKIMYEAIFPPNSYASLLIQEKFRQWIVHFLSFVTDSECYDILSLLYKNAPDVARASCGSEEATLDKVNRTWVAEAMSKYGPREWNESGVQPSQPTASQESPPTNTADAEILPDSLSSP